MKSQAFNNLKNRLKEIDLLLEAHEFLVKFHKAKDSIASSQPKSMQEALKYLQNLVEDVGPGRPPEVQAVNKAAIVLLSAELQGYLVDLHKECADMLFQGRLENLETLIAESPTTPTRGNPNVENITRLFGSLGFSKVLEKIRWQKMKDASVKKKLKEMNELRNRIAHSTSETVRKVKVDYYLNFVKKFSNKFDEELKKRMTQLLGKKPW